MLEVLVQLDKQLFRWVNGHYAAWLDWPLWTVSQHWFWLVAIGLLVVFGTLWREPRRWWLVGLGIGLCFLLADQGSVQLFKNTVCRLRPCHELDDVRMFMTRCGGQYGFVSSHAANAFAVVTFFWLRYRRWPGHTRRQALALPLAGLAWALVTCYSRVYLGKHYPGDIVCGALFGMVCGCAAWWVCSLAEHLFEKKSKKIETKK